MAENETEELFVAVVSADAGCLDVLGFVRKIQPTIPEATGFPLADALAASRTPVESYELDTGEIIHGYEAYLLAEPDLPRISTLPMRKTTVQQLRERARSATFIH